MYWSEGITAIGPKECPNAVSACRLVSQNLRQIRSALIVLKKVRRIRKPSGRLFSRRTRPTSRCPTSTPTSFSSSVKLPMNLGDVIHSVRFRTALPDDILATQPPGMEWIIEGAGKAAYRFKLVRVNRVVPRADLVQVSIPDATPEIIRAYAKDALVVCGASGGSERPLSEALARAGVDWPRPTGLMPQSLPGWAGRSPPHRRRPSMQTGREKNRARSTADPWRRPLDCTGNRAAAQGPAGASHSRPARSPS